MQLDYASKQREKCANVNQFSKALDVSKEMDDLRLKKRRYQEELSILQKKEKIIKRVKKCKENQKMTEASKHNDLLKFACKSSASSNKEVSSESSHQSTLIGFQQSARNVDEEPETDTNQNHDRDDEGEKDKRYEALQASQNVNHEDKVNETDLATDLQPKPSLKLMFTQGNMEQDIVSVNGEDF